MVLVHLYYVGYESGRTSAGFKALRPLDDYQTIQILLCNNNRRIAAVFKKSNSFSGFLVSSYGRRHFELPDVWHVPDDNSRMNKAIINRSFR